MANEEKASREEILRGSNIEALRETVRVKVAEIARYKTERKKCNENINALRGDLEASGLHKKAIDVAMWYVNADPDKRQGFDIAYEVIREALGLPVQSDLFNGNSKGD